MCVPATPISLTNHAVTCPLDSHSLAAHFDFEDKPWNTELKILLFTQISNLHCNVLFRKESKSVS